MLAIRMQRTGRKAHATFRVVVQESRLTPTSGKIVALLGSYDPHTKASTVNTAKASFYLEHGAQPSERVVRLLTAEGVKLPEWAKAATPKTRSIRNAEKLRRNQPKKDVAAQAPEAGEAPAEAPVAEETAEAADSEKTTA